MEAPFIDAGTALVEIDKLLISLHLATAQDKKTKTHGGEYKSPCPLCKVLDGGDGGNDRARWHPYRPIFGAGSKDDPIFACRICKRSGDLVGLYQQIYNVTFPEALAYFEIGEYTKRDGTGGILNTTPKLTGVTLPDTDIMELAWDFVKECVWNLWNTPAGAIALKYLRGRGLKDETILAMQLGYNPETRKDDPELWGLNEDKDILIPKGIVIPEIHISSQGSLIYSISIRRSNKEILEYFDKHEEELPKYHVVRLIGARSLYTVGLVPGQPATLHEGQINAMIAWQESGYGAAATQSADGAQDNMLTTAKFLALVKCWLLCQEKDEAGIKSAKYWKGVIPNSIVHHPPDTYDMDEFYLAGGNVKGFIDLGVKRFDQMWKLRQHWTKGVPEEKDETLPVAVDYVDELPVPKLKQQPLEDAIFSVTATQERPLEELDGSTHQTAKQGPEKPIVDAKNVCLRCGEPAKYEDRYGNFYCGKDSVAYRIMKDGGVTVIRKDQDDNDYVYRTRFTKLYFAPRKSVSMPVVEGDSWSMQEVSCDETIRCIETGRDAWLEFCRTAPLGNLWLAATELHQQIVGFDGFEPYHVVKKVKVPCTRMGCMHEASAPARHNDDVRWDGKYKWSLVKPHTVKIEEKEYVFCPHCVTFGYLLEFAKTCLWWKRHEIGVGDIQGDEEWLYFCATASAFAVTNVFDAMRRDFSEVWKQVQQRIG